MRIFAAALLIAVLGCSKSKPATTPPPQPEPAPIVEAEPEPAPPPPAAPLTDAEFAAMMDQALAMFNAMGAAVDAAGDSCSKLAAGLNRVLDDHAAFVATAKQRQNDEDVKARGEEWMKSHMDEVMAPMMKVATAGQKCTNDAAFAAFQKRFEESM